MVRTVQILLHFQLACNEMQASARTCGRRTADSMIENVGQRQVKSIYFNHPSQGNSTNYYLILGLRDKAAPPTSQQINKSPPKRVKNLATPSSIFIFVFLHPQESSALSQSEVMIVQQSECSQNMLSEAFWTPKVSSTNTSN